MKKIKRTPELEYLRKSGLHIAPTRCVWSRTSTTILAKRATMKRIQGRLLCEEQPAHVFYARLAKALEGK